MKKILHTSFPCIIKCGEKKEEFGINEKLIIDSDEPIMVYPIGKDKIAFAVDINPSPFYRIIKKDDEILIFLLGGLFAENIICREFSYNGNKTKIEVGTNSITFCGYNDKKVIHLSHRPTNVEFGSFLFISYVLFNDDRQVLIAYNPKKNRAKIFSADKIEIEKDGFTLYKSPFSYRDIIERYYVDNQGLKVLDKNFNALDYPSPTETISYKFMTSIKCGDYSGAFKQLSPHLQSKLDERALKEYFGDISYFYILDPLTCFAISNEKNVIYQFSVDDKITEISNEEYD